MHYIIYEWKHIWGSSDIFFYSVYNIFTYIFVILLIYLILLYLIL